VADDGIPVEVRDFLTEFISSIEQLEILLLLQESRRPWTAQEISQKMHISQESVERRLEEFVRRELFSQDGHCYSFTPKKEQHNRAVNTLSLLYKERRVAIITSIFSNPVDHIQTFADAFKLKPKN
jgi:hypothetical protein